jgi:mono/diheme cytochrome c family protein
METRTKRRGLYMGLLFVSVLTAATAFISVASQTSDAQVKGDPGKGKLVYGQNCQLCHGESGKGNGPGSAGLNPTPKNFTDAAGMAKVTRELMIKAITQGGAAVGVSPVMPSFKDNLSSDQIQDVVEYVRTTFMH